MKIKKLFVNILVLCISCVIALLLVEIGLRIFSPGKGGELIVITFSEDFAKMDEALGFKGIPFAQGVSYNCETKVRYKHNSRGWRNTERAVEKTGEIYRALMLGDSFVWGVGVGQESVLTYVLEDIGDNLEVINVSFPRWATVNEYRYFETEGIYYKPDMLLVMFFVGNDLIGNGAYEKGGYEGWEPPTSEKKEYTFLSYKYIQDHSRIYRRWKRKRRDLKMQWGLKPIFTEYDENSPEWKATTGWIDRFRDLADKEGVKLVFVLVPEKKQFFISKGRRKPQDMLIDYMKKNGVAYLDLLPVFEKRCGKNGQNRGYFRYDGHWNELGHRVAAEEIYKFIEKERP